MGKITLLLLLLLINPLEDSLIPSLKNKTFQAKVIGISDGDTMEVLYQNNPIKIRLAHIDCPEKRAKQPFGNNAKKALSDLCFGQMVTVKADKYDRYKRLIAVVINHKKQVVNQEMIKQGFAWHYKNIHPTPFMLIWKQQRNEIKLVYGQILILQHRGIGEKTRLKL